MYSLPKISLAVLLSLGMGAQALGQDPTVIERPIWKVGESWTYNNIDNWKKVVVDTSVDKIVEVSDKEIKVEWKSKTSDKSGVNIFNQDFNGMVQNYGAASESRSTPYVPRYLFPISVGKTWQQDVTFTRGSQPDWKVRADLHGTALKWEKITIPAGTFNALKIELTGLFNGSDSGNRWSGKRSETYWFAPEAKRIVKYEYDDGTNKFGFELVDFKLSQ